jgi:GNAT superfamily N-acetyltransferase
MIIEELRKIMPLYLIQEVTEVNIEDAFHIMIGNEYYHSKTQNHELTMQECVDDIHEIPPNTSIDKKTYVMIYKDNQPIALLDFVEGYPDKNTGYLGLLMLSREVQRKGLGRSFVYNILSVSREIGLSRIELACYERNLRGLSFWENMGFKEIRKSKRIRDELEYTLISMDREL